MSGRIWLICTLTLALLMSVPGGAGNISQAVSDIEVFIVADGKQCLVEERPDVAGASKATQTTDGR